MPNIAETGAKLITESRDAAASYLHRGIVELSLAVVAGAEVAGDAERNGVKLDRLTKQGVKFEHPTLAAGLAITGITAVVGLNRLRMARNHRRDADQGQRALAMHNISYADPAAIEASQALYDSQEPRVH